LLDGEIDSGVANGGDLLALSEALVGGDEDDIRSVRARVIGTMGSDAVVDAIGVYSNFERMVRIADATGVELGESLTEFSEDIRADLGIERPPNWAPVNAPAVT